MSRICENTFAKTNLTNTGKDTLSAHGGIIRLYFGLNVQCKRTTKEVYGHNFSDTCVLPG